MSAEIECRHSWVAGMMYVHDEDLQTIARERSLKNLSPVECEKCDEIATQDVIDRYYEQLYG